MKRIVFTKEHRIDKVCYTESTKEKKGQVKKKKDQKLFEKKVVLAGLA
jgi:hypothetical protein